MSLLPETRESLLIRLADAADAAAWDEFVAIYRPMILRLGLRKGLQATDADDLAQLDADFPPPADKVPLDLL